MLPFISTKEVSTVAFSGEFAKLLPGRSQLGSGENGVSLHRRLRERAHALHAGRADRHSGLAPGVHAAAAILGGTAHGPGHVSYRRAKLAWYTVDQTYYTDGPSVPAQHSAPRDLSEPLHPRHSAQRGVPEQGPGRHRQRLRVHLRHGLLPAASGGPTTTRPISTPTAATCYAAAACPKDRVRRHLARPSPSTPTSTTPTWSTWSFGCWTRFIARRPRRPGGRLGQQPGRPTTPPAAELLINLGNVSEDVLRDQQPARV
ncbi:MAG: hypothetical protein WKG07_15025 [Hymenobacter sp.]